MPKDKAPKDKMLEKARAYRARAPILKELGEKFEKDADEYKKQPDKDAASARARLALSDYEANAVRSGKRGMELDAAWADRVEEAEDAGDFAPGSKLSAEKRKALMNLGILDARGRVNRKLMRGHLAKVAPEWGSERGTPTDVARNRAYESSQDWKEQAEIQEADFRDIMRFSREDRRK